MVPNKVSIFASLNKNNMETEIITITDTNDGFAVKVLESNFISSNEKVSFVVKRMDDANVLRLGRMLLDSAFVVMDDDGDNPVSKVKLTITYEQIAEEK